MRMSSGKVPSPSNTSDSVNVEWAGEGFTPHHPTNLSATIGRNNMVDNQKSCIGVLDVYIHQARDIHNICIYHNQDVYAKLCLTTDPDTSVSTQIINGGGRNPVFNEQVQLKVHTVDSSLKFEVWMLSRVRNYLEDQLLGFTLVPISDVLAASGELLQDFSLSSTDLFHSPAGFIKMSLSYNGSSPDVVPLSSPPAVVAGEEDDDPLSSELCKIEFPDPKIVNENEIMVSEYIGIHSPKLVCQTPDSLVSSEDINGDAGEKPPLHERLKKEAPLSSATPNGSSESSIIVTSETESDSQTVSDGGNEASPKKIDGKNREGEAEINSRSETASGDSFPLRKIDIKIEPEQQVVQQDIVDMYLKSMQQFTESLAKMKLPIDVIDNGAAAASTSPPATTGNSPTDSKEVQKGNGSRVFYGSRAFF